MIDPESSIDIVLAALKATEPSPGFERRLLEALAAPSAASPRPARRWLSLPALARVRRSLPAAVPFFLAAALLLTLSFAFFHQHVARTSTVTNQARTTLYPHDQLLAPSSLHQVERPQSVLRHTAPHSRLGRHGVPASHAPAQLASFPAPPLPLTSQEKLLLRVAHAQNPQQSALLNPALRASLAARDNEDFQIFFASATAIPPEDPPPN